MTKAIIAALEARAERHMKLHVAALLKAEDQQTAPHWIKEAYGQLMAYHAIRATIALLKEHQAQATRPN